MVFRYSVYRSDVKISFTPCSSRSDISFNCFSILFAINKPSILFPARENSDGKSFITPVRVFSLQLSVQVAVPLYSAVPSPALSVPE